MKRNLVAWAALAVAVAALVAPRWKDRPITAAQSTPSEGLRVANALSEAFNSVAESVKPSVVQINVVKQNAAGRMRRMPGGQGQLPPNVDPREFEEMLRRFFGRENPQLPQDDEKPAKPRVEPQQLPGLPDEGTGSGFVYDKNGHILTNAHVVMGADSITVTFHDGVTQKAEVVGSFREADVAVLKVKSTEYPPLRIGQSEELKVGQWVIAVGSPFGYSQTVTSGIVSATDREDVGINFFESFIQTDAAINPGNSGGPLVDLKGQVVGINSAIATLTRTNSGIGFAIPIDMATRLADKLIKNGKIEPALMGVSIEQNALTPDLARQLGLDAKVKGVLVTDVNPNTPAEKAGLKVGDVITSFDNHPVHNRKELQYLVMTSDVGQAYPLVVLRDGQEIRTSVTPEPYRSIAERIPNARRVLPRPGANEARGDDNQKPSEQPAVQHDAFGIAVAPLNDELAERFRWEAQMGGLVVVGVKPDSPAAIEGLEPGDRITKILANRKIIQLKSVEDYRKASESVDEMAIYVEDVRRVNPGQFMTLSKNGGSGD